MTQDGTRNVDHGDEPHAEPVPPSVAARALRALREREAAAAEVNEVGGVFVAISRALATILFGERRTRP